MAESDVGAECSYPVFVAPDASSKASDGVAKVRLRLRPGVVLRGRLLDSAGRPVAGGECVARWVLPPGAHVASGDESAAAPRHRVIRAGAGGELILTVPPGLVHLRGRLGPGGGLGPALDLTVADGAVPADFEVRVGAAERPVRISVSAPDGTALVSAFAMLRTADVLHAVVSASNDGQDVGAVFADASGVITISGVAAGAEVFEVGIGAAGYVPQRVWVRPGVDSDGAEAVVLKPKVKARGHIVAPDGARIAGVEASWDARMVRVEDEGKSRSMARAGDVIELVQELTPSVESQWDEVVGEARFSLPSGGTYEFRCRVQGLPEVTEILDINSSGVVWSVRVPEGRRAQLRAAFENGPHAAPGSWRLAIEGRAALSDGDMTSSRLLVGLWTPDDAAPMITLWCPRSISSLEVRPATPIDLPIRPVVVGVPDPASTPVVVPLSAAGCGWIEIRSEAPPGPAEPGGRFEVLSIAVPGRDDRRGARMLRPDAEGAAIVAVPPGDYFVGRDRRDGDPRWIRTRVESGATTRVIVAK